MIRYLSLLAFMCIQLELVAQPTNVAVYEQLAITCLGAAPDTVDTFYLEAPNRMAYLRPALTSHWQQNGHEVFLSDSVGAARPFPKLEYNIDEAHVAYARINGQSVDRTVVLGTRYNLAASDGRLLGEARCRETHADTLRFNDLSRIETDAYPETRAVHPPSGGIRRYLEPAVLGTAVGVVVYLFFSIRS